MSISRSSDKIVFYIFTCIGAALSITVSALDFSATQFDTSYIKYFGVVLCACFASYSAISSGIIARVTTLALFFTVIADMLLLIMDAYYEVGVCAFIIAQCCYMCRIYIEKAKFPTVSSVVRLCVFAVISAILFCLKLADALTIVAAFYACMLVGNLIESYTLKPKCARRILFSIGLTLFACCDLCVMLYNMNSFVDIGISEYARGIIINSAWAFYLPSQVLISLSAMTIVKS